NDAHMGRKVSALTPTITYRNGTTWPSTTLSTDSVDGGGLTVFTSCEQIQPKGSSAYQSRLGQPCALLASSWPRTGTPPPRWPGPTICETHGRTITSASGWSPVGRASTTLTSDGSGAGSGSSLGGVYGRMTTFLGGVLGAGCCGCCRAATNASTSRAHMCTYILAY